MPMTQQDIRSHYRKQWGKLVDEATDVSRLKTSTPVEDATTYPLYRELVRDLRIRVDEGFVLDVGPGSGRWIRFFLEHFRPRVLMGVDVTPESIKLLEKWCASTDSTTVEFRLADITDPDMDLNHRFDLVNISRVLFHIPEPDLHLNALKNLAKFLRPNGHVITTEYLPRTSMRTEFMYVHSRYEFEAIVAQAGLRIVDIRAFSFFPVDPFGIDGPDDGIRQYFWQVKSQMTQLLSSATDPDFHDFLVQFLANIERATLGFCRERIADIDMPSQKLVVLARA